MHKWRFLLTYYLQLVEGWLLCRHSYSFGEMECINCIVPYHTLVVRAQMGDIGHTNYHSTWWKNLATKHAHT